MSVVESGSVRPGRDVPGELSLVSRGQEVFKVTHMELNHSVTETFKSEVCQISPAEYLLILFVQFVGDIHKGGAASLWDAVVDDDLTGFSTGDAPTATTGSFAGCGYEGLQF